MLTSPLRAYFVWGLMGKAPPTQSVTLSLFCTHNLRDQRRRGLLRRPLDPVVRHSEVHRRCHFTAKSRDSPGTPLRVWTPRSSNVSPEPATRSLTVLETRISPPLASPAMRAPM